jgi:SAM-dependent methyltransferase
MGLKHSPERAFHQAFRVDCLRDWYAGSQGQRVLELLRIELGSLCTMRFGDCLLELAPIALVSPEWTGSAWTVRVGSGNAGLQAEPHRLPLAPKTFSCVLVAHVGIASDSAVAVITEAARVLAPEGHLLLLEITGCPPAGAGRLRTVVPVGLQRRLYRQWLEQAGLDVHRQRALSLLPGRLPQSLHRRLGRIDALAAPWLPFLGNCVLTVARRRDAAPLSPKGARLRWSRPSMRPGRASQWA